MSRGLSAPPLRRLALWGGVGAVTFAILGALLGVLLDRVWVPAKGLVIEPPEGLPDLHFVLLDNGRDVFAATGWFVLMSVGAGLLAGGVLATVVRVREPWVLLGGLAGTLVMEFTLWWTASWLGPEDPERLAMTAAPDTVLPVAFEVTGSIAWLAGPLGLLVGFLTVALSLGRAHSDSEV